MLPISDSSNYWGFQLVMRPIHDAHISDASFSDDFASEDSISVVFISDTKYIL